MHISSRHISIYIYTQLHMLGGWVNPHREQQTIPQGQTSLPPKSFSTPTANGQSAPRTGSARGVGRRGEPHTEHGLGVRDRRKSLYTHINISIYIIHHNTSPSKTCSSTRCRSSTRRHAHISYILLTARRNLRPLDHNQR